MFSCFCEVVEATEKSEILLEIQKVNPPRSTIIDWLIAGQDSLIINQIHTLNSPHFRHIIALMTKEKKTKLLTELQIGTDEYLDISFTSKELQVRIANYGHSLHKQE